MRCRALLTLAALAFLAATGVSCLSPTLPLPPPEQPDGIAEGTNGLWGISGQCIAGAIVTVWDTDGANGALPHGMVVQDIHDTGTYSVTITGRPCDTVWVEQQTDDGPSPPTMFVLQAVSNGEPVNPLACE